MGSTRLARRAGIQQARIVAPRSSVDTEINFRVDPTYVEEDVLEELR